jgi:LEA14-like dessication related protein
MNTKMLTILLIILIIINATALTFIFIDIQVITAPETNVSVSITEVTEDHIKINTTLQLKNSNLFALALSDFTVATNTTTGQHIGTIHIIGGYLEANELRTFTSEETFSLENTNLDDFTSLITTISGIVKVRVLGIVEKTVPLSIHVITSLEEVLESIHIPTIELSAAVKNITKDGVVFAGTLFINNPNSFPLHLTNIFLNVTTPDHTSVGSISIKSGTVPAQKSQSFPITGVLQFAALNIQTLTINISARVGATIAGINHTLPFSSNIYFEIPDLNDIISLETALGIKLQGDFTLRFRGIIVTIILQVDNPSNLPLASKELVCFVSRIENNEKIKIAQQNMTICLDETTNNTCVVTEIVIPYRKFLSSQPFKLLPDFLAITILGDFALEGVNQSLPVELNGYLNPHLFVKK